MWNYLLRLICIAYAISSTGCASAKRKAEQMESETRKKRTNVETRHNTEVSSNDGMVYKMNDVPSLSTVSLKPKVSDKLKPETIEKRTRFEQTHQNALSSNPEHHRSWSAILHDPKSECQWLLRKILPKKNLSTATGKAGEVTLMYKHLKDENNKPFPHMKVAALLCQFPEKCKHGTRTTYIRSPDPNCIFFMNRLSSNYAAYFITEEICKSKIYPRFWDTVLDGKRRPKKCQDRLQKPDTSSQQEEYERKHIQHYLENSVKYQVWPELEQADTQIYCHMIFEKYLPGTMISILDIKSRHMSIELYYQRIKDENNYHYPSHEMSAFFCELPPKFRVSSYQFIRSPNLNCLYLIRKRKAYSEDYRISREICDQNWNMKNFYHN